jgi:hypothetical protein
MFSLKRDVEYDYRDFKDHIKGKCNLINFNCIQFGRNAEPFTANCNWCRIRCRRIILEEDKNCNACFYRFLCWTEK